VRLAVRALTGIPLLTVAADGQRMSVLEHRENRYLRKRQGDGTLSDLTGVPIRLDELTALLAGRLPGGAYSRVGAGESPDEMVLAQSRWGGTAYRVNAGPGSDGPLTAISRTDRYGAAVWRGDLFDYQAVEPYRLPTRLALKAANGAVLNLRIARFVVDEPVDDDLFVLDPPT
jgi:hypothetical protein